MRLDKKNPGYSARLKYLFMVPLFTTLLCISTHAFAQGPPGPPPGGPPPPPNPLNLFKKHKKDTTKKIQSTTEATAPSGPSAQPAGPPPPPNPLNLFKKKKKDTTKTSKN